MGRRAACSPDRFAASLAELLGDVPQAMADGAEKAVGRSCRKGAKLLRGELTEGIGRHEWSEEYRGGFSSHVERRGLETAGEVGNEAKPGLVHLLENGHATPTGRRTARFEHMAPAFEEMEEDLVERIGDDVRRAIG